MGLQYTLTQEIFNFPARRQRAVKFKMALTSQQRGWCVLGFHKTNSVVTVQRAFKRKFFLFLFPLGVREGQSLYTSTTRNRG